jgi:uncharacterized caspase-like protein
MSRFLPAVALVLLAIPIVGMAQQRASGPAESRTALVIGNANYKDAPLANPVNDARAVAKALNEAGFRVKLQTNLTQAQMRRAIREFGDELHARQGVGLFYFAGHGVQLSNRNFLIPVGSDIQREYEVEDQSVDAGAVLSMMHSAKARVNIVILDACRNNPFVRDFRSTINGLAPMQAPAGTLVAFSTAPGQTAIDGTGQFGLYTEQLVANLTVPGLKIEDVFKNVRIGVQRSSGGRQVPWENTSLTGDFYFMARAAAAGPRPFAAPAAVPAGEIERAVQEALDKREADDAARRAAQQSEIEVAVLAALRKREGELAAAQGTRAANENKAAKASIERLNRELAELRALREAEKAQAGQASAVRKAGAPTAQAAPASEPPASPPVQLALAAPTSRPQPVVNVGGRVERPDVRVGDRWKYRVTDRWTNLTNTVEMEAVTVTESRIYTKNAASTLTGPHDGAAAGVVNVWDRDWNPLRQGDTDFTPYYPSAQFPLEAGKQWRGSMSRDGTLSFVTVTYDVDARVAGWERVTVPAGTFDAIKIVSRGRFRARGSSGGDGTIDDVAWYAPAIRQFVRKEIEHQASRSNNPAVQGAMGVQQYERWELLEYRPH